MSELDAMPTEDDVMDALSNVIDPELGLDFVELGLIYGVEVDEGNVQVTFTLTTPGCPIGPQVTEQIEEFVGELDDVQHGGVRDGVHAAVVAGEDDRGREVRARLLAAPCRGSRHIVTISRAPSGVVNGAAPGEPDRFVAGLVA